MEYGNILNFEDKILIKTCDFCPKTRQGMSLQKLQRQTLDDFNLKLLTTNSIDRIAGSCGPRSYWTADIITTIEDTAKTN